MVRFGVVCASRTVGFDCGPRAKLAKIAKGVCRLCGTRKTVDGTRPRRYLGVWSLALTTGYASENVS